jgi:hypothetical protein
MSFPIHLDQSTIEEAQDDEVWSAHSGDDEPDGDGQSKKRKRPMSVSCETCVRLWHISFRSFARLLTTLQKQRKVRCDRGQPACGWCLRNNQLCEYKERKKPGLRAGYGRELESRLDKLEGVLQTQQHVLQQLASHLPALKPDASPSDGSPLHTQYAPQVAMTPVHRTGDMASTVAPVARRVNDLQTQMAGDMNQQGASFLRHASQTSLHIPGSVTSGDGYAASNPPLESPSLNIPGSHHILDAANAIPQDPDLPPYDLLYALTDLFFKHINTWCPILHRRTTLDALFGSTTLDEADRILLHAIVATTLRFSVDPRLNETNRERYHSLSKQRVLLYGLENSSVKALQALVSCSEFHVGPHFQCL